MSLIKIVDVENATGKVKDIYEEIQTVFGSVPNGIRLWSINPDALEAQWNGIKVNMGMDLDKQKLYTVLRFLIAENDDCEYCTGFNKAMLLNMYGFTLDEIINIQKDISTAPLEVQNKALLVFALKSLEDAHSINKDDISNLESLGCSQKEIFDIVTSAGQMRIVTTLFDTFKVEIDY